MNYLIGANIFVRWGCQEKPQKFLETLGAQPFISAEVDS